MDVKSTTESSLTLDSVVYDAFDTVVGRSAVYIHYMRNDYRIDSHIHICAIRIKLNSFCSTFVFRTVIWTLLFFTVDFIDFVDCECVPVSMHIWKTKLKISRKIIALFFCFVNQMFPLFFLQLHQNYSLLHVSPLFCHYSVAFSGHKILINSGSIQIHRNSIHGNFYLLLVVVGAFIRVSGGLN